MPLSVDQSIRKAKRCAKAGDADQAAAHYKAVLAQFPGNKRALEGLSALGARPARKGTTTPQDAAAALIALSASGRLEEVIEQGALLLRRFPDSFDLHNIIGVAHSKLGRHDDAAAQYRAAVRIKPDFIEAYWNLGNALKQAGRAEDAVASYEKAFELAPDRPEACRRLADALIEAGRCDDAVPVYQKALALKPDYLEAHFNLANAYGALGRYEDAAASYEKTIALKPGFAGAHYNLGGAYDKLGRREEAIAAFNRALEIDPGFVEAWNNLGNVCKSLGRRDDAVVAYRAAIARRPDYAEAYNNLGDALTESGRPEEAIEMLRRALDLRSDFVEAHNNLGNAYKRLGRQEDAVACYQRALSLKPDYAEAHFNLGNPYKDMGRQEDAIVSYQKAVEINPGFAEAHNNLGAALTDLGRREDAVASYEKALEIDPGFARAHRNLSTIKRFQPDDPQIDRMARLLEKADLSEEDRMHLSFGLGKACDDLDRREQAFECFSEGNRLRKKMLSYSIETDREAFRHIKAAFAPGGPLSNATVETEPSGPTPIFIVGMPRSGTSLVEQVLASHSQVYGGGEMLALENAVKESGGALADFAPSRLEDMACRYRSALTQTGAATLYVTDKLPINFRWIGCIKAALPEAKIVHVKRDARATCWSIFKHYFASNGNGYAYDLNDVADYYALYQDMMNFWEDLFPGAIHHLDYERLTENQGKETRALLDYIGLAWEDRCLEFHKTKRAVATASALQVKEKMYQGSSQDWRRYEQFLKPHIARLKA